MRHRTVSPRRPVGCALAVSAWLAVTSYGCAATPDEAAQPTAPPPVKAALEDAARQTGIAVASLRVTRLERVTWLDGSLGCPEPDMMYTQALVPGFRIRIEAGGKSLDYHADAGGTVLLCPPERAVPPAAPR